MGSLPFSAAAAAAALLLLMVADAHAALGAVAIAAADADCFPCSLAPFLSCSLDLLVCCLPVLAPRGPSTPALFRWSFRAAVATLFTRQPPDALYCMSTLLQDHFLCRCISAGHKGD